MHRNLYSDIIDVLHAAQPTRIRFADLHKGLDYMKNPTSMPGELEITTICHAFKNTIFIFHANGVQKAKSQKYHEVNT